MIINLKFEIIKDLPRLGYIYHFIKDLNNYYPDFYNWYYHKFLKDVLLGNDIALVMKNKQEKIIGVSLLKDQEEKKLRCIRILPEYQNKGYGLFLIDKSLKILNYDKPSCTVAEEMFHYYSRILINRYGFVLNKVEKGLYRKGKLEYIFNNKDIK